MGARHLRENLVSGEGFAVDASLISADANKARSTVWDQAGLAAGRHGLWQRREPWLAGREAQHHPLHPCHR